MLSEQRNVSLKAFIFGVELSGGSRAQFLHLVLDLSNDSESIIFFKLCYCDHLNLFSVCTHLQIIFSLVFFSSHLFVIFSCCSFCFVVFISYLFLKEKPISILCGFSISFISLFWKFYSIGLMMMLLIILCILLWEVIDIRYPYRCYNSK